MFQYCLEELVFNITVCFDDIAYSYIIASKATTTKLNDTFF